MSTGMDGTVTYIAASLIFVDRGWAANSYQHIRILNEVERTDLPANRTKTEESFDYFKYHRYNQLLSQLENLARTYPNLVNLSTIGHSSEGRPLKLVTLGRRDGRIKPVVWIDAGMHAREWIAPAMAMYVIHRLIQDGLGDDVDWCILPVMNPDGYEFTHTRDRLWRKTRSKIAGTSCRGVDLNRNFDFHFNEVGASDDPCDQTYHGGQAFTEPESTTVRDFIWTHKSVIVVYLSLHSFGSIFLHPWAYKAERSSDWRDLDSIARRANDAQVRAGGKSYRVGTISSFGFAGSGGSDDWAKGIAGIKYSYSIELFGGWYGFKLPEKEIEAVVVPMFEAIRVFGNHAKT